MDNVTNRSFYKFLSVYGVLAFIGLVVLCFAGCATQPNLADQTADELHDARSIVNRGVMVNIESYTVNGQDGDTPTLMNNLANSIKLDAGSGDATGSSSQQGSTNQQAEQQGGATEATGKLKIPLSPGN